jgi:phenylacetate-CoA ligase
LEETGRNLTLDRAISLGDLLDDATRKQITTTLAAEVYDIYGMNEVGEIAWECPTRSGYHINAESVTLEFLQNGEPVAAGETGEMHVTCFNRTATPIIRYSTGDMATSIGDDCPCGRGLPLLKGIQGRVMDFIRTKNGRFITPYVVIKSIQGAFGVEQFKVIQDDDYSVEVFIETSETRIKQVLQDVEMRCSKVLGGLSINVRLVDSIENGKGPKYRLVESRLINK